MSTLFKAGNATSGASFTPDSTGSLEFRTGSGSGLTAMTIDASQNVSYTGTVSIPNTFAPASINTAGTLTCGNTQINGNLVVTGTFAGSFAESIFTISASAAASALTITLNNTIINFRSNSLTSGTISAITVNSPISITVPSGATLGTANGVTARIMVLAINNGGTAELAVVNQASGLVLDESGIITTANINSSSDLATTIYSTTQRIGVAYRVVGFIQGSQATAGTWNSNPQLIQGAGGNSVVAVPTFGYGQIWQDVTRVSGSTYYNTTGKAITLICLATSAGSLNLTIDTYVFPTVTMTIGAYYTYIIPPNSSYVVNNGGTLNTIELR